MIAQVVDGELDLADICFLVALVLFGVVAVIRAMARALDSALMAAGAAALTLGWLVL